VLRSRSSDVLAARSDLPEAQVALEDAADLFVRTDAPFDLARGRIDLGMVPLALGDPERGDAELAAAHRALTDLGAYEARRAEAARSRVRQHASEGGGLTERERDVLRLAADGLSNTEIAARSHFSVHTAHRHMANIRTKLGGESKAAVVARAAREGWI